MRKVYKYKYKCDECGLDAKSKKSAPRCYACKLKKLAEKKLTFVRKDYELSRKQYACPVCNETTSRYPYTEMCMKCQTKNAKVTAGKTCPECNERKITSHYAKMCGLCKQIKARNGRSPICACGKKIKGDKRCKTCWDCHRKLISKVDRFCFVCKNKVKYQSKNINRKDEDIICVNCYKGSRHKSYNPRKTDEEREHGRCYSQTKIWRTLVCERDDYTCQNCGVRNVPRLNAHHIENYADYPSVRFEVNNGITLCEPCHKNFHREYSNRHNNIYQLLNFLTP